MKRGWFREDLGITLLNEEEFASNKGKERKCKLIKAVH